MKVAAVSVALVLFASLAWAQPDTVETTTTKGYYEKSRSGASGVCEATITGACTTAGKADETKKQLKDVVEPKKCSAAVGAFNTNVTDPEPSKDFQKLIHNLVQHHFENSMMYLELANYFNEWNQNRKGFHSYFMKMSDDTWEDGVDILQHLVLRGGHLRGPLRFKQEGTKETTDMKVPCCELQALGKALDLERSLVTDALNVLKRHGQVHADPEFSHFLAKKIFENHAIRVKHLANHVNTLSQALDSTLNTGVVLHIYDTQLLK